MSETLTTQVLIDRIQHGDRAAREELCNRYLLRVLAAVRARLGRDLRERLGSSDIVQEVMLEALGKLDSFDFRSEGAFMKYLNRLVENEIRDQAAYWGAKIRKPPKPVISIDGRSHGEEKPLEIEGAAQTPSEIVGKAEDLARVVEALDLVAARWPEYRDLIIAVEYDCQTYVELAKEGKYGKTPDAIRMKFNRAEAKLAAAYHEIESRK